MKYKYLVAAALQEELHAFIKLAGGKGLSTDVEEVTITAGKEVHKIAVFTPDKMGMPYNAGALMDYYHKIKPKFIIYIGTCAGLGNYEFGTVMIPKRAFSYESGKISEGNFLSDYISYEFGIKMRKLAVDYVNSEQVNLPYTVVTDEDMCSEAAVIDDYQRVLEIKNQGSRKLRALEMEAFSVACLNHILQGKCEFLVVKSISDLAKDKEQAERKNGKEIAKTNAADFTYRFLQHLLTRNTDNSITKRSQPFIDNLLLFEKSLRKLEETEYIDAVSQKKLAEIRNIESQLSNRRILSFDSAEMEHFTNQSIRKLFERDIHERTYHTTHIVNNQKKYLDTWQKDTLEQNDRDDFVRAQVELLNHGGEVIRIFIFHRPYFEANREDCIKMLKTHNSYYQDAINQISTLVYLFNPKKPHKIINHDFSIVGDEIVFKWYRAKIKGDPEYPQGICCLNDWNVKSYREIFNNLKKSCKKLEDL